MDTIKIKHREFTKVKDINDNQFVGLFKNKQYMIYRFDPHTEEGQQYLYYLQRITNTGIRTPKLYWVDKKAGYAVRQYLEGEYAHEIMAREDLPEEIYKDLFFNNYMAKMSHMTLDYTPSNWLVVKDTIYYMKDEFILLDKKKDLVDKYIRLWFNTKELAKFLAENGYSYDKKRIKDEYSTNKGIVLMTCKYYR